MALHLSHPKPQTNFRWVGRYDPSMRTLRICRVVWQRGTAGDGKGYSCKLSLGLRPDIIGFALGRDDWELTLLGLRVHYQRSYGGTFV